MLEKAQAQDGGLADGEKTVSTHRATLFRGYCTIEGVAERRPVGNIHTHQQLHGEKSRFLTCDWFWKTRSE